MAEGRSEPKDLRDSFLRKRKDLEEVFEKIAKSYTFEDKHLELSSDIRADSLVKFLEHHFNPDETIDKSIGLDFDDVVCKHIKNRLKENISVLLISNITDDIIACLTMAVIRKEDNSTASKVPNDKLKAVHMFIKSCYNEMDVFRHFDVDTAVSMIHLATHKDFRCRGLASTVMEVALKFCEKIGLNPVCIQAEGTGNRSQRIFEKFGFEKLHTIRYDEYRIDGEVIFKNTSDNKTMVCYVKKL